MSTNRARFDPAWSNVRKRVAAMAAEHDTLPTIQSRVSRARLDGPAKEIVRIRDELLEIYAAMRTEGLAPTTEGTYSSALRFWHEFAQIVGLDVLSFGRLADNDSGASRAQIQEEDDAFMLFLVYVVKFPRQEKKVKDGAPNTATYAESCLSAVKSHAVSFGKSATPLETLELLLGRTTGRSTAAAQGRRARTGRIS
jgi:hypothetical protein